MSNVQQMGSLKIDHNKRLIIITVIILRGFSKSTFSGETLLQQRCKTLTGEVCVATHGFKQKSTEQTKTATKINTSLQLQCIRCLLKPKVATQL
jgi:hypothetical protein